MATNIKIKRTTGVALPTGLTFGEMAYVLGVTGTTTANQIYIGNSAGSNVWVGARIENTVLDWTGTEANSKLATQQAIDARILSRISSNGGFTFAATSGTPQTLTPGDTITIAAGSGISTTAGATDTITIANTGVTGIQAGTAISVSSATGFPTITNTGVQTIAGTANQITASGSTGAVTLSLPSAVTMPGSLTVTGNLTVNGTTTTVNSTTVTVQDPIISIGGLTGGIAPAAGDTKDRGIVALYRNTSDTAGLTGFFGIDQSTGYFTYVPDATVTSEVISGTVGTANFNTVRSTSGTVLNMVGPATSNATLSVGGGASTSTSYVAVSAGYLFVGDASASSGTLKLADSAGNFGGSIVQPALSADRTWSLPTHANGTLVAPSDLGTSGYILKANGTTSQPTWISPTSSGFTAYAATYATNVVTTEQSTGTYYLTFASGANATGTGLSVDATATTALSYNVATGTLACAVIDALVDGGAY